MKRTCPWPTACALAVFALATVSPSYSIAAGVAAAPSKELALDLGNKVAMKLTLIPAGKFMMGSPETEEAREGYGMRLMILGKLKNEGPRHEVTISKPFYIGIYPVKQAEYQQVMGKNPSESSKGPRYPVENVNWFDATKFCKRLTEQTGKSVHLPTEAQWEYACRAGTATPFNTGETISTDQANFDGRQVYGKGTRGEFRGKTTPVDMFKPNAWGLYDMHGNVHQWCADWYGEKYYSKGHNVDPKGPSSAPDGCRMLRGGSWLSPPQQGRSAYRYNDPPVMGHPYFGFRVVVDVPEKADAAAAGSSTPAFTGEPAKQPAAQRPEQIRVALGKALQAKDYPSARDSLGKLLLLDKEDQSAWYDLACVESVTNHPGKAIDCLRKAFDNGYADFRHLTRDSDLDSIRQLPQYKDLLAHKEQIERTSAARIQQQLRKSLGGDYLIETDEGNRMIFATNLDRQRLDEVKQKLAAHAEVLWNDLFDNRFEQYLTVIMFSDKDAKGRVGGGYDVLNHRLGARQVGNPVGRMVLTHEFTHALHWADMEARGQGHPIWIAEGFATLCETSEIVGGHLVPLPNTRLGALKAAIQQNKMIPLRGFVKLDQRQYMQQPLGYPESRYIMMYLYSKGLLKKWYDAYVAGFKDDPTGGQALEAVLGKNLDEIEKDFAAYVTALKPVPQPYLGINTSITSDGMKITHVAPGSGAFDAGLKVDDLVTCVDGQRIPYRETLLSHIAGLAVGGTVQVEFQRDGKDRTVSVTLKDASIVPKQPTASSGQAAESAPTAPAGAAVPTEEHRVALGVNLDDGAVIQAVGPGLGAAKAGLRPGDAIVAIDGRPIKQTAEVTATIGANSAGDKVRVTFVRDGKERVAEVTLMGLSEQQQAAQQVAQRAKQIHDKLDKALKEKDYSRARNLLGELLSQNNQDGMAWYDLACVESITGHSNQAIDCLKKAVGYGYVDFRQIRRDPDLESIRNLSAYKDILAHEDQYQRAFARRIVPGIKKRLGGDCQVELDDENRLVIAAGDGQRSLDEMKQSLVPHAKALWNDLFANRFGQYVAVMLLPQREVQNRIGGGYNAPRHQLLATRMGSVLLHEFTHALHSADQEARGQNHPIWIAEGFATLAETSEIDGGHLVPLPNPRLDYLKKALPAGKLFPIAEFIKFGQPQYMQQAQLCYAEGRYIMMYLHSKGVLRKWYEAYTDSFKDDPSGGKALEAVLGKKLVEIDKDFAAYIKALPPMLKRPPKTYLGIGTSIAAPDGLLIATIGPGSGAADAGLKVGDVLTRIDGKPMYDREPLVAYVSKLAVGATIQVEFRRDGKYQTVPVVLKDISTAPKKPAEGTKAAAEEAQPREKAPGALGVGLDETAVVLTVAPDSGAAKAGLQPGDKIIRIDNRPIESREDASGLLSTKVAGDKLRVVFVRAGKEHSVEVTLQPKVSAQDRYTMLIQDVAKAIKAGDHAKVAEICLQQAIIANGRDQGVAYGNRAIALAHLGKKDEALKALKLAVDQGFAQLDGLENDPVFNSIRSDKRWATIMERAIKNYERETGRPYAAAKQRQANPAEEAKRIQREAREKQITELRQRFNQELAKKDYQAAEKTCRELLALLPKDGATLYNLACVKSRLKESKEALEILAEAIEHGGTDADQMKDDEDLATLRDEPGFKELVDRARKMERTAYAKWYRPGKEIAGVKTLEDYPEDGLRYRLRMSPEATAEKPNRLIVWMHPSAGQDSAGMNNTIEAMTPMFLKHGYALVVFTQKNYMSWSDSDAKKLFVTLDKIGQIPGIDARKPILFGYSAGGQMALELFMKDPTRLGGMVLDAAYPIKRTSNGGAVPCFTPPKRPDDVIKNVPILVFVGTVDGGSTIWRRGKAGWKGAGVPLELTFVPNKRHEWLFDAPRTRQLEQWLSRVAVGELPGKTGDAISDAAEAAAEQEGLSAQPGQKQRVTLGLQLNDEATILEVKPGSGAAAAGLQTGDTIVRIEGKPIKQREDVPAALAGKAVGDKVRLTITRDGKERTVEATLGQAQPRQQGGLSPQQQAARHAMQMNVNVNKAMHDKDFARARELLDELLRTNKNDQGAWYNLACLESLTDHADKAIVALKRAIDCGYADFRNMERDADLDAIRQSPEFKDFLARKDQIQRARAARIAEGLRKNMGNDYLVEVDDAHRLVFATNIDRQTLDEVKQKLTAQAKALWNDLFDNHFEQYVTIIVPSEKDASGMMYSRVGGGYDTSNRRLVAKQIGYPLTHEFTHALHWADVEARGQIHPIWIAEGFATFSETSNIEGGHLVPLPNPRLGPLQDAVRQGTLIPLRKFVKFDQRQYMQQPDLCYGEGRYLMIYLYSKGVLRKWYDAYVAGFKDDPTGGRAMQTVLGKNLDEIEKDFVAYVKTLAPVAIRPTKGYLGISTSMMPDGLKITNLVPGSGAFDAGLKLGDIITHVDGKRMVDRDRLLGYISGLAIGATVKVAFRRDGKYQTVPVKIKAVSNAPVGKTKKAA